MPDNVPIEIETSSGSVRLSGVRATVQVSTGSRRDLRDGVLRLLAARELGLRATSAAAAECSADRLELRSRSGDVRAVVPSGRYQIDAQSDSGSTRIRGVTPVQDAPFQIQALSTSGDVTVEASS